MANNIPKRRQRRPSFPRALAAAERTGKPIHGHRRLYLRRKGHKLIRLPGIPGSDEFMAAYAAALAATESTHTRPQIGASRTRAGSISAMIAGYLGSAAFAKLELSSQGQYRRILEGLRANYGDMSMAALQRKHVMDMLDDRKEHPSAARDFLRCLRLVIVYALDQGVCRDDPTIRLRVEMPHSDGFHSWSEEEIEKFRAFHLVGSKPRLALELLLATALRCCDVIKLGPQHIRDGVLSVSKTQKTKAPLTVPVSAELATAIAATPIGAMLFLLNERGEGYTAAHFGVWFVRECERAGLTGCSAHGVRKAVSSQMAEAGCTAPEIVAVTGHRDIRVAQRYIEDADQKKLASSAVTKLRRRL
jgi:integrase